MENSNQEDARLKITEFTDPWCTWCWGSEPILRRIMEAYGDQVEIDFVMGGLVEDMETFYDALNNISAPEHVPPPIGRKPPNDMECQSMKKSGWRILRAPRGLQT